VEIVMGRCKERLPRQMTVEMDLTHFKWIQYRYCVGFQERMEIVK
jgi:hypothetical protein